MTVVRIDLRVPAEDGTDVPATGWLELVPTRRRSVGDSVVLPNPFAVRIEGAAVDVDLAPCSATDGWCWRVREYVHGGATRYVLVPEAGPVGYEDLVDVDPETLEPAAEPEAAWNVALADLQATVDSLVAQSVPPEEIAAAVEAYMLENPVEGVTQETLDAALAGLTAADVGADPAGTAQALIDALTIPDSADDIGAAPATHTHVQGDVTGLDTALAGKADATHTHAQADVTGLDATLAGKADDGHTHAAGDITSGIVAPARLGTGTPTSSLFLRGDGAWATPPTGDGGGGTSGVSSVNGQTGDVTLGAADVGAATAAQGALADSAVQPADLAPVATSGAYTDLTGQPAIPDSADDIGAAPAVHTHAAGDVTGLATVATSGAYADLIGQPAIPDSPDDIGAAAAAHTHAIADTTGLQGALDAKAPTSHTHAITDTTDLQATLDAKAASIHTHAIDDVTGLQDALDAAGTVAWVESEAEADALPAGTLAIILEPVGTPDTTAPSAPTGLSSSNVTSSSFDLSWTASTDNVGVTGYNVYLDGVQYGSTVAGTSVSVTGRSASTTYSVTVRALDAAGNLSDPSGALSVTTGASADATAPSVPTGLASSNITDDGFTVTWDPSTDDVGVTGYEVFLDGVSQGEQAGTSKTFTGLDPSTAYSVTVRARDAVPNWSAQSSALAVTTTAAASGGGTGAVIHTATAEAANNTSSGTNPLTSIAISQAPTAGNLLVSAVGFDKPGNGTLNLPTGWTLVHDLSLLSETRCVLAYKVADGTETSVDWSGDLNNRWAAVYAELSYLNASLASDFGSAAVGTTHTAGTGTAANAGIGVAAVSVDSADSAWGSDVVNNPTWSAPYTRAVAELGPTGLNGTTAVSLAVATLDAGADVAVTVTSPGSDGHALLLGVFA